MKNTFVHLICELSKKIVMYEHFKNGDDLIKRFILNHSLLITELSLLIIGNSLLIMEL